MNQYPNQPGPQNPGQYPLQQPPSGPYPSNPGYPPQAYGPYTQYPPQQPGYPPGYQMPPVQPPQQKPKKKGKALWITLGVIVGAVVLCAAFGGWHGDTSTTPSSPSNPSNSNSTQQPSKPLTWTTTHTYTGNGNQKTETIAVPNDWKILWSCDASSFMGSQYNVVVEVDNSDGTPADPAAVNTLCSSSNTSGVTEEHAGGNVYLNITSEAAWSILVQEPK